MPRGRFAPSPTGPLHVGNLRTALLAWLLARQDGSGFVLRVEDLDPGSRPEHEAGQLADLEALGIDWDGPVLHQSARRSAYAHALADLEERGLTYPCYCTRREVQDAAAAPHGEAPEGAYPGTCLTLTREQREERVALGRPPALRLRADGARVTVVDELLGPVETVVDDMVLRRNDGLPAYNLTVVVDDAFQRIEQVVRGADLLSSTPRQVHLARLLGLDPPRHVHVPLVVGPDGGRLAKRRGDTTLAELRARGVPPPKVRALLLASVGLPPDLDGACRALRVADLPVTPWAWHPESLDPP